MFGSMVGLKFCISVTTAPYCDDTKFRASTTWAPVAAGGFGAGRSPGNWGVGAAAASAAMDETVKKKCMAVAFVFFPLNERLWSDLKKKKKQLTSP